MRRCIPTGIRNRLKDVNQHGLELMGKLYEVNARINVVSMLDFRPSASLQALKDEHVMSACLKSPFEALELFDPFLVQGISRILYCVVDDLKQLAKAVYEARTANFYHHLISITIPAVFGHFALRDSLELASAFYREIFQYCSPAEFTRCVVPFFRCSSVATYGRILYEETSGKTFLLKQSNEHFAESLLGNAIEFLRLLPSSHLAILKLISERWESGVCWRFLIDILVIPMIRLYGSLSVCEQCDKPPIDIPSVIQLLSASQRSTPFDISSISPVLEIPRCFIGYGICCPLKFIVTLRDVFVLEKLNMNYPTKARDVVKSCSYTDLYQPFTVKIFSKALKSDRGQIRDFFVHPTPIPVATDSKFKNVWDILLSEYEDPVDILTKRPVFTRNHLLNSIFRSSDLKEATDYAISKGIEELMSDYNLFEEFLKLKLEEKALETWLCRCRSYLSTVSSIAIRREMRFCVKELHTHLNTPAVMRRHLPLIPEIQHWAMIHGLCFVETKLLEPHISRIQALEKNVEELCKSCRDVYYKRRFENPIIQEGIWRAAAVLPLVTLKSRFIQRFTMLRVFLESIENLVWFLDNGRFDMNYLIHFSIAAHDASWIVRTVMLLEATILYSDAFMKTCTQQERDMWNMIIVSLRGFLANGKLKDEYEATTKLITR